MDGAVSSPRDAQCPFLYADRKWNTIRILIISQIQVKDADPICQSTVSMAWKHIGIDEDGAIRKATS